MNDHNYFVYIMTNKHNTVVYTGVTSNLEGRVYEHKQRDIPGFTRRYNVTKLLYYEHYDHIEEAITREKRIKGWLRDKKEELINRHNPGWKDLSIGWYE